MSASVKFGADFLFQNVNKIVMCVEDYYSFISLGGFLNSKEEYTLGYSDMSAKDSDGYTDPDHDYRESGVDDFISKVKRN